MCAGRKCVRTNQLLPDDLGQIWAAVRGIRDLVQETFKVEGPYLT